MRCGMSVISNRYVRVNILYLKHEDYDISLPNSYICYLKQTIFTAGQWVKNLPVDGFRYLSQEVVSKINFTAIPDDSEIGYVIECDLE